MQLETSARSKSDVLCTVAKVISKIMNPFSLCALLFLLVAWAKADSLPALLSWIAVILLFLVVWPPVYVYIRTSSGGGKNKGSKNPMTFFRHRQRDVLIIGVTSVVPCVALLIILNASSFLTFSFVVMLAISMSVALLSRFYKASLHLAIVTGAVIVLALTWERTLYPLLAIIPVVGWARYTLGQHNLKQLATGTGLAAVISILITYFWLYS